MRWPLRDALWFQAPIGSSFFVILPAAALLFLAWASEFPFPKVRAGPMERPSAITALLVYLTLGAGYSCWHYCLN